ncbi:2'-5' RNA ligase family protein [Dyadobacter psychrotolerans]|uniref:2'-5' RNA ligase family protein n=1 Tax=Dyadobacter psychrotolerans TaxID=2541721 RepID=A0A4R5E0T0_9BACT|nr:2'-5' RNA ligase family protein [Dyadobacter psychrotolerans]TDE18181.1 hypothetical protein E0F88_01145 [Dyadobacter psychrotolerans]
MEIQNLYFIAIIPPEDVCDEIITIQRYLADRFQTRKSLKVVPHITLKAPFACLATEHQNVVDWFDRLHLSVKPFSVELNDFGSFPNSKQPVIYIKPEENQSLTELQKSLLSQFQTIFPENEVKKLELIFRPHLTVAYRDLKPEFFRVAWKEFSVRKYGASFDVGHIHLLLHDQVKWNLIRSLALNGLA